MKYQFKDIYNTEMTAAVKEHYYEVLANLGENPNREGLRDTPERAAKAMQFLTQGYDMDPVAILEKAKFAETYNEMVLVKDIEVYSLCEHHILPFFGKAHIAYIPNGHIVGLSKIPRIVDVFARRLQVQERLTEQIAEELKRILQTEDVAVIIDAEHMCVSTRGIEDVNSSTVTAHYSGVFKEERAQNELFKYLD